MDSTDKSSFSQIHELNSFATPFPTRSTQNHNKMLSSSPPYQQQKVQHSTNMDAHPMSWMQEDEDLEEEWISEPEEQKLTQKSTNKENSDSICTVDYGTTKVGSAEKVLTPEWKRALNQNSPGKLVSKKSSLENMFRPLTMNAKDRLDIIPEGTEKSNSSLAVSSEDSHSYQVDQQSVDEIESSRGLSNSPLKLFQKHDTYTNSKFEGILGSLENQKDNSESSVVVSKNSTKTNTGESKKVNHQTTQDYLNDADQLMQRLRGMKPQIEDEQFVTNSSASSYNDSSYREEKEYSSLRELEFSLRQHQAEPETEESDSPKDTFKKSRRIQFESDNLTSNAHASRIHPAMALIGPDDIKGLASKYYGSMDFDPQKKVWMKRKEIDFGTGSTKVDSFQDPPHSDVDVFEGIEDLSDGTLEGEDEKVQQISRAQLEVEPSELREQASDNSGSERSSGEYNKVSDYPVYHQEGGFAITSNKSENEVAEIDIDKPDEGVSEEIEEIEIQRSPRKPATPRNVLPKSSALRLVSSVGRLSDKREVSFRLPTGQITTPQSYSYLNDFSFHSIRRHFAEARKGDVTNINDIEASFSTGYGKLVKVLTNLGYDELYWDDYKQLKLNGVGLEALSRLDEICPKLTTIDISNNKIAILTGAPKSLRKIVANDNKLSDFVSFGRLTNIQYLNLANNDFERLTSLSSLCHLRELNINNNRVCSLEGISHLDGLLKLSANGNQLTSCDFKNFVWQQLEELELSGNRIQSIDSLEILSSLGRLSLDNNELKHFTCQHGKLRKLSVQGNQLTKVDVSRLFGLKELYLDNNKNVDVQGFEKIKLDILSIRHQKDEKLKIVQDDWHQLCELRKLRLSGNLLTKLRIGEPFLNLHSLELSGIGLKALPKYFNEFMINLRQIDLSFNQLHEITPLFGIPKLRCVYLYGNKIGSMDQVIDFLCDYGDSLAVLDLRNNPLTSKFYYADEELSEASKYKQTRTKAYQEQWKELDKKYQLELRPEILQKRRIYQAIILSAIQSKPGSQGSVLRWLDGWMLSDDNVYSLEKELQGLL